jgi:hypothetical protein
VATTRTVVYLAENLVARLAHRTSHIRRVGFGLEMISSVLQFENCVITDCVLTPRDADVGIDLSVLAQPAFDLGKIPLDSGNVVGIEVVGGG